MKKDELVVVTSGIYSDYSLGGLFQIEKDFSIEDEVAEYDKIVEKEKFSFQKKEHWKDSKFIDRLVDKGYMKPLPFKELTSTDYLPSPDQIRVYDNQTDLHAFAW